MVTHIVEGIYEATLSWLTDPKFEFYYRNLKYVGHVWAIGVVYVREGEWDRIFLLTG